MRSLPVVQFLSPLSADRKWDRTGASVRGRGDGGGRKREARDLKAWRSVRVGGHRHRRGGNEKVGQIKSRVFIQELLF